MKVLRFQIPENGTEVTLHDINGNEYKRIVSERKSLEIVRDLLCFCCFTSLRYSDMDALKCTDIVGGKIYVTTMKTDDSLVIEVNKFAQCGMRRSRSGSFRLLMYALFLQIKMTTILQRTIGRY